MKGGRTASALVIAVALASLLSACVGAPAPAPAPGPVHGLPDGVVPNPDIPAEVPNDATDRLDVILSTCEATADGWMAGGTVLNPGEAEATYEISIFFTTGSGTVIEYGTGRTVVGGGATADWTVSVDFVAPPETTCVVRGVAA